MFYQEYEQKLYSLQTFQFIILTVCHVGLTYFKNFKHSREYIVNIILMRHRKCIFLVVIVLPQLKKTVFRMVS